MSNNRYTAPLLFSLLMLVSAAAPLVSADGQQELTGEIVSVIGNPATNDLSKARQYLMPNAEQPVFSATRHMSEEFASSGFSQPVINVRTSGRACTPWAISDTTTMSVSGSTKALTVQKVTPTAAFMVEDGYVLQASVLNDWATTWDQTIEPVLMTYFGKDYNDGNGLSPPDTDNNCQIEVVIIEIDGAFGTGGFFSSSTFGESVFVDYSDASLPWSKVILAHELQHLLHNALDPNENNWVDEGAADMAAFLCFGGSSTLYGHVNAWSQRSSESVRWWDQSLDTADYGAGFLFMLYLADQLGGGAAIRNLVSDSSTGWRGVENLGLNPIGVPSGYIGDDFNSIWKNFSIAATLDSDQSIYGMSNIDLTPVCSSNAFCRVQPAETNSNWDSNSWVSTSYEIEGWGLRVFKLEPGGTSAVPLTLRLTGSVDGFQGITVSRSSADGQYTVNDISFTNGIGTGMVSDFGGDVDEVHVITWLDVPNFGDCNYNNCGFWPGVSTTTTVMENTDNPSLGGNFPAGSTKELWTSTASQFSVGDHAFTSTDSHIGKIELINNLATGGEKITFEDNTVTDVIVGDVLKRGGYYPVATVGIEVARIVDPASLSLDSIIELTDRDGDTFDDTVRIGFEVDSNAFLELLDVEVVVSDSTNAVVDTITQRVQAGGSSPTSSAIWFTADKTDNYLFEVKIKDLQGNQIDSKSTPLTAIANMRPTANGSVTDTDVRNWENIQFLGGGVDRWGLSLANNTLPYNESPVAYLWDFDDGNDSGLHSPVRSFPDLGQYNVTLRVQDGGGDWSDIQNFTINITDDIIPVPIIRVNGVIYDTELYLLTGQTIQFDAIATSDNVPDDMLHFSWDWGDGEITSGLGIYQAIHMWADGDTNVTAYVLNLSVSDGTNVGYKELLIYIQNRPPELVYTGDLTTLTYTPLTMADTFDDVDGQIIAWEWVFSEPVNLAGENVDRTDLFISTVSSESNPSPAWNSHGLKNITVTAIDNDGDRSTRQLQVMVINQRPTADFSVRDSTNSATPEIDFRVSDGRVGTAYTFDGRDSYDPDGSLPDSSILTFDWLFTDGSTSDKAQVSHNFSEPGQHWARLIVTDEVGDLSEERNVSIIVVNPLPLIELRILEGWIDDEIIDKYTPMPVGTVVDSWSHTFDPEGRTYAAIGTMLYFDSTGTRDGDDKFDGRFLPLEMENSNWNGLVEYTWDFGDATPVDHDPMPWHHYELPGNYTITLIVRDSYLTGDVTRASFEIVINEAPVVNSLDYPLNINVNETTIFNANITDLETDEQRIIWRDTNVEDGDITNKDVRISSILSVKWDLDLLYDDDGDGDSENDWIIPNSEGGVKIASIFNKSGYQLARIQVCDGLGICVSKDFSIEIKSEVNADPSFSEFSMDEWKAWAGEAGSDSLMVILLLVSVLILGWAVMRTPTDLESEAGEAAEVYEVEHVEVKGGVLGMDQHTPPPAPEILSKENRRSTSSGYVRPLRRRP
jgi:PKD repeat protein